MLAANVACCSLEGRLETSHIEWNPGKHLHGLPPLFCKVAVTAAGTSPWSLAGHNTTLTPTKFPDTWALVR